MGKNKGKGKSKQEETKVEAEVAPAPAENDFDVAEDAGDDDGWQVMGSTGPTDNNVTGSKTTSTKTAAKKKSSEPAPQEVNETAGITGGSKKKKGKKEPEPEKPKQPESKKKAQEAAKTSQKQAKAEPEKPTTKASKQKGKKNAAPVEQSSSEEEPQSPEARREGRTYDRTESQSESPSPHQRRAEKNTGKGKKTRYEPQPTKDKRRDRSGPDALDEWRNWLSKNWKTTLLITLGIVLLIWVKLKEDQFNMMSIGSTEHVSEDLYGVLGVSRYASTEDIKKAYKQKAQEVHPDKNPGCEDCPRLFDLVTKAHNTLTNPDSRKFYDTTEGIMTQLKSTTHQLTAGNWRRLVEESNDIWIILVYQDNDDNSATFMNFWDEAAKEFPFIQFGRINFLTQQQLVNNLPFKILEIPFVLSYLPSMDSEIMEYDGHSDVGPQLRKFIRESIDKSYIESSVEDLKKVIAAPQDTKPSIIQVTRSMTPIGYSYLASKFGSMANFYTSKLGDHKRIFNLMEATNIDYIVKLPKGMNYKNRNTLAFRFGTENKLAKEADHLSMFPLVKFLMMPELKRSSFNEFCSDYTTSEDSESIKPSLCVVALKSASNDQFGRFMDLFHEEQQGHLPTFYQKTSEMDSDIFDAVKSVQFAWINYDSNKKFRNLVEEKVDTKNPRAFIYVSAINKVKFYNDPEDLADDLEDALKGTYNGFKHANDITDGGESINNYLMPDNLTVLRVFINSIYRWFTTVWALALGGLAVFGLGKYGDMKYHIVASIIGGMFLSVALFEGFLHSNRLGLL